MNLIEEFSAFISKESLFLESDRLLIAVSGGVDSVVLCALCRAVGLSFSIAHANFQLRGQESERDEVFVRRLGEEYGVQTWIRQFDTEEYARGKKLSIQVAARELRYAWFDAIVKGEEPTPAPDSLPTLILTAHHADDNLETMLMNFFKGTGIAGLRGLQPRQGKLVRPLLFARKAVLLDYAEKLKLAYVEDSSNASVKYTRNYFRHELIPALRKTFPAVEENLVNNLSRFREIEQLYQQAITRHVKNLVEEKAGEVHIPVLKLKKTVPLQTVVYEIIKAYGFTARQVHDVVSLLESGSGKYVQSAEYRVIRNRDWLIITPLHPLTSENILIEASDHELVFARGRLQCKMVPASATGLSSSAEIAHLDAAGITFPLLLRKRKQGDYFYPLGMQKKKKLSRFLTDLKLSITEKENTWVLEMNKRIIWVVGKRIDDRFKVTPKTKDIFQITFTGTGL